MDAGSSAPGPKDTKDAGSSAPMVDVSGDAGSSAPMGTTLKRRAELDAPTLEATITLPEMVDTLPSKRQPDLTAERLRDTTMDADGAEICSLEAVCPLSRAKRDRVTELRRVLHLQNIHCKTQCSSLELTQMAECIMALGNEHQIQATERPDVAEIYSPPRFTAEASRFGLRPGFAVDWECLKRDGQRWDLRSASDQAELERMQEAVGPYVLTGGPPCEKFCNLQALNRRNWTAAQVKEDLEKGRVHLRTAVAAYHRQMDAGRYFLHEHPKTATSWGEPEMLALMKTPGVYTVQGPMCRFDMMSEDEHGVSYVKKETQFVTNSPRLAEALQGVCSNMDGSRPWHRHVHLINGRASRAKEYPPKMVIAVLKAIREQMIDDGQLSELSSMTAGPVPEHPLIEDDGVVDHHEDYLTDEEFDDDVNGGVLDPRLVRAAREEELRWLRRRNTWTKVPWDQAISESGKQPISLRWVDTNKGDDQRPDYRSRLVVREIRRGKSRVLPDAQLFSSMPPLEALKTLCSLNMTLKSKTSGKPYKMQTFDIRRAHLYGKPLRRIFVHLPEEEAEEGYCALLNYCLYGTQDASACWEREYVDMLTSNAFEQGVSAPAIFYNREHDLRILVHGDDFVCLGDDEALDFMETCILERYDYKKSGRLGGDAGDVREISVLNRFIRYSTVGGVHLELEADPRHAEIIVKGLGLQEAKSVTTPSCKLKNTELDAYMALPPLGAQEATQYRSLTMRAAYLAQDRADLGEAVKALSRHMKEPNARDLQDLKKLGRYLKGRPRAFYQFRPQRHQGTITVYVDTDHAGCLVTRKSTTGMNATLGNHTVRTGSNMQTTIALSSGESEYYGLVKGCAAGLGLQSLLRDWGLDWKVVVKSDSSAARAMASRRGLGKLRHVQTRYLWIQQMLAQGLLQVLCIKGADNTADILTKDVAAPLLNRHCATMALQFTAERLASGKRLLGDPDAVSPAPEGTGRG